MDKIKKTCEANSIGKRTHEFLNALDHAFFGTIDTHFVVGNGNSKQLGSNNQTLNKIFILRKEIILN